MSNLLAHKAIPTDHLTSCMYEIKHVDDHLYLLSRQDRRVTKKKYNFYNNRIVLNWNRFNPMIVVNLNLFYFDLA